MFVEDEKEQEHLLCEIATMNESQFPFLVNLRVKLDAAPRLVRHVCVCARVLSLKMMLFIWQWNTWTQGAFVTS